MGLIGNLKDAVRKTADEAVGGARAKAMESGVGRAVVGAIDKAAEARQGEWLAKWPMGDPAGDFVLEGKSRRKAYVYDPAPLAGLADGAQVVLDVVPGDLVLYSRFSGKQLDTAEDGGCVALAYGSSIIGACWAYRDVAMRLVARGYRVRIRAEKRGMVTDEIPNLYVVGPDAK